MKNRFIVKQDFKGHRIFDRKLEESYENIIADDVTLHEICRILNALQKKNDLATERIESQCDTIRDLKKRLDELKVELKEYE